jgi:hypothetical protein
VGTRRAAGAGRELRRVSESGVSLRLSKLRLALNYDFLKFITIFL